MNNTKALHDVGAFYFFLLAFLYLIAALAFRNNFFAEWMLLFMRVFDVPLALVAIIYGSTSLQLQISDGKEEEAQSGRLFVLAASILVFALVIFINFAFPSVL